jgi:putative transposase
VYHARPEFKRFQRYSGQIARLQLGLPENRYSSQRIQRLHDKRTRKHNHSRNAAVKHICEWLLEQNVDTVYVGDLSDVLDTHWSAMVNEKTYAFWSHGQLVERIELTLGDTGITVHEISEEDSSSQCPGCDSKSVQRSGDEFHCHECESEAHRTWLERGTDCSHRKGSMTRSAALRAGRHRDASQSGDDEGAYWERNKHDLILNTFEERSCSFDQTSFSESANSHPCNQLAGLPTEESNACNDQDNFCTCGPRNLSIQDFANPSLFMNFPRRSQARLRKNFSVATMTGGAFESFPDLLNWVAGTQPE